MELRTPVNLLATFTWKTCESAPQESTPAFHSLTSSFGPK